MLGHVGVLELDQAGAHHAVDGLAGRVRHQMNVKALGHSLLHSPRWITGFEPPGLSRNAIHPHSPAFLRTGYAEDQPLVRKG
jgi:hypothetical protein